jgi:hypothetical protein
MASLTFTENPSPDPNDYFLNLTIAGSLSPALYVDQVEWWISGVDSSISATGYTSVSLTAAPGGVGVWATGFDNINAGHDCDPTQTSGQGICSLSASLGPQVTPGGSTWTYSLNLAPGITPLSTSSQVTLRALFTDADGKKTDSILSPAAQTLTSGPGTGSSNNSTAVPEPASLALLGSGLAVAAARFRRRNKKA